MANKRMISKLVISTDDFLGMSIDAQSLFFQLQVEADEYGFIANPMKIVRGCLRHEGDLQELVDNGYCHRFPSGHLVMMHWLQANKLERKRTPVFENEFSQLQILPDGSYGISAHCPEMPGNAGTTVAGASAEATAVTSTVTQTPAKSKTSSSGGTPAHADRVDERYVKIIENCTAGLVVEELTDLIERGVSIAKIANDLYGAKNPVPWREVYHRYSSGLNPFDDKEG